MKKELLGAPFFCLNTRMMSFEEFFFVENLPGEKKSKTHTNLFKGARVYDNGNHQNHKMTYDSNRRESNQEDQKIENVRDFNTQAVVDHKMMSRLRSHHNLKNLPGFVGRSNEQGYQAYVSKCPRTGVITMRRMKKGTV